MVEFVMRNTISIARKPIYNFNFTGLYNKTVLVSTKVSTAYSDIGLFGLYYSMFILE